MVDTLHVGAAQRLPRPLRRAPSKMVSLAVPAALRGAWRHAAGSSRAAPPLPGRGMAQGSGGALQRAGAQPLAALPAMQRGSGAARRPPPAQRAPSGCSNGGQSSAGAAGARWPRLGAAAAPLAAHRSRCHSPTAQPSQKRFAIKKKLAKKAKQNRPIPPWIRFRTNNTLR